MKQVHEKFNSQTAASRKVTKKELAENLSTSVRTIDNMMQTRQIPFLKIGRMVRFDLRKVEEALGRYEIKEIR